MQLTLQDLSSRSDWALLVHYLRGHRFKVVLSLLLLLGTIGLQLINPQIVRRFFDAAQAGESLTILLQLALFFWGVALLEYLLTLTLTYVSEDVGWRTTNALRADLAAHCLHLDMAFHHRFTPGALIERIDGDVGQLARFFSQLVIQLLGNGLLLIGILVVLSGEDWRLGLGFLLFLTGALWILFRLRNFATTYLQEERAASADLFGFLEERLGGTEDIRANGAVAYTLQRFFLYTRAFWRKGMAARPRNAIFGSIIVIWFETGTVLALALGSLLFLRGALTIGTVYLLYAYLRMVSSPLLTMTGEIQHLQEATAAIRRVRELLAERRLVLDGDRTTLPAGPLAVDFDRVSFRYDSAPPDGSSAAPLPVLQDFSLTIPAGQTLGLLGRTGSGKTTLTRLLLRLYDPQNGAVRLQDMDLRALTLPTLRRHVAIVTQDVQLFQATVRDNLTFYASALDAGKSGPHDEEIVAALTAVGMGDWLRALPAGLDTELQSGGNTLSSGEAQLLAFARVLLRDPGVVILDEASSRLDPITEARLDQAVTALLRNRTAIVIAHRLETIRKVDTILILDEGRIRETGPRAQLAADPTSRFAELLRTDLITQEQSHE
ncbi:MAG TPA: ABC transporter ATP-binding protein [Caldilineaceae bacterium]|nr:ABC transporter ATP-binding protein [Caldilineaceae bacterium]